jgi:4-amino-4-deoxy-L-arabinose transferase-like glycosyltransferase
MKNNIVLIAILVLAFVLRALGYENYPRPGSSFDEYGNTFVGMSLIKLGYPVGFTTIDGYVNERNINFRIADINDKVLSYKIVDPWFDHPPLICMLTGWWASVNKITRFNDVRVSLIRQPLLFLGVLSVYLVFLFGKELFGKKIALLAAFLYAILPVTVIGSRTVQAENLLILLSLLVFIFLKKYLDQKKLYLLLLSGIFLTLSVLAKFSSLFVFLSIIILLLQTRKNSRDKLFDCLTITSFFVFGLLIFGIFGLVFDFRIFLNIFFSNSNRFYGIGFDFINYLLRNENVTINVNLYTGFNLVLWISFLIFSIKKIKKANFIIVPVLVYLAVSILFGNYRYGWYTFPFFPFLIISGAWLVEYFFNKKKQYFILFYFGLLIFSSLISQIVSREFVQIYKNYWRYLIFVLFLIYVYFFSNKNFSKEIRLKFFRSVCFGFGIAIVFLSMIYVFKLSLGF